MTDSDLRIEKQELKRLNGVLKEIERVNLSIKSQELLYEKWSSIAGEGVKIVDKIQILNNKKDMLINKYYELKKK